MLLRDVREIQKVRERPGDGERFFGRPRSEKGEESLEIVDVAFAAALGECAHALDHREELIALLGPQCLAQQAAEEADVVAQGAVGQGGSVLKDSSGVPGGATASIISNFTIEYSYQ